MVCRPTRVKFTLLVANSLLWVLSLGLVAYGMLLWFERPFQEAWDVVLVGAQEERDDLPRMRTRALAIALIAIGGANFVIGAFGWCGALRESRPFLALNIFFMVLSLLFILSTGITAMIDSLRLSTKNGDIFERSFTRALVQNMSADRTPSKANDDRLEITEFFYAFQASKECCGSHNWTDYFNKSLYQNQTSGSGRTSGAAPVCAKVPVTCCLPAQVILQSSAAPSNWSGVSTYKFTPAAGCCDGPQNSSIGRHQRGCLEPAYNLIKWNLWVLASTTIIYGLYQVFCVVQASFMWCLLDKDVLEE